MDKDKLFEILDEWNYWHKPLPKTYKREFYEKKIAKYSSSGEIIVIKGVRRSGKSTLLLNEIKRLIKNGVNKNNILFVNLEDQRFRSFKSDNLLQEIKEIYLEYIAPKGEIVIMLDEVQNISNWEQWVLKEYELGNHNLYITGSNSHLLGSEFATSLAGRYLSVEVYPLSFKEFLEFHGLHITSKTAFLHNKIEIKQLFGKYMEFGGFPKVVLLKDEELKIDLLKSYYDTILLKDIVARHKLKNYQTLNELSLFLLSNNSTINAYNKLKNNFNSSFDTIKDYMEFLYSSYIIQSINKFDYSYKKQIANAKKMYAIDIGLSNIVSFKSSAKKGANLENLVFLELKRRYSEIYYYKTKSGYEVDFLVKDKEKIILIQVSFSLEDLDTFKREIRVFGEAKKELKDRVECIVITLDNSKTVKQDNFEINIINFFEFCLNV